MLSYNPLVEVNPLDYAITPGPARITPQATSDEQLIALWLHGRSKHTIRAYERDIAALFAFVSAPLGAITLQGLQDFADSLSSTVGVNGRARTECSQKRTLSAVKSLLSFGQRVGYLQFNIGTALRLPSPENTVASRLLTTSEVHRMIWTEPDHRKQVLLRLLYASAGRVSEICGLCWRNVQEREDGGQVSLYGKGSKTRAVRLYGDTWTELLTLREGAGEDSPIFATRSGRPLSPCQAWRFVRRAAINAGITRAVSPHWFRHSHATHALDRKCPINLLQATLGHSSVAVTGMYTHANPDESSGKYLDI